MRIEGPNDLQQAMPAKQVATLRGALKNLGYEHEEAVLRVKKATNGHADGVGVRVHMWGDREVQLTLQDEGGKLFACNLESLRPGDYQEMGAFQKRLVQELKKTQVPQAPKAVPRPAPPARTESGALLKVFGLKEADVGRFPTSQQLVLEAILADMKVSEDVVLRFDRYQIGTMETKGIHIMDVGDHNVTLSLQQSAQSARAVCVLTIKGGETGAWLMAELEKRLAQPAPSDGSGANANGTGTSQGEKAMSPMTPSSNEHDEEEEPVIPPNSSAPAVPPSPHVNGSGKAAAKGFTAKQENINRFVSLLRANFPEGLVTAKQAGELLGSLIETADGSKKGLGLIVATFVRMGYLVATEKKKRYRILAAEETPVRIASADARRNTGSRFVLPGDDPAMLRFGKLNLIVDTVAKRKAEIGEKKARLETMQTEHRRLVEDMSTLAAEIASDEASLPTEEALAEVDDVINRFANMIPELVQSGEGASSEPS